MNANLRLRRGLGAVVDEEQLGALRLADAPSLQRHERRVACEHRHVVCRTLAFASCFHSHGHLSHIAV